MRIQSPNRMMSDKESGQAKGYAFCEYYDKSVSMQAVQHLNKHEISGRTLKVDYGDDYSASGPGGQGGRKPFRKGMCRGAWQLPNTLHMFACTHGTHY